MDIVRRICRFPPLEVESKFGIPIDKDFNQQVDHMLKLSAKDLQKKAAELNLKTSI